MDTVEEWMNPSQDESVVHPTRNLCHKWIWDTLTAQLGLGLALGLGLGLGYKWLIWYTLAAPRMPFILSPLFSCLQECILV